MSRPLALLTAALLVAGPAVADEARAPEKAAVCASCHGADGKATLPGYPHLAGQYASYLEQALREYRAGTRKNPIMASQATSLTDADIRQLAKHFAGLPGPLHTPSIDAGTPREEATK